MVAYWAINRQGLQEARASTAAEAAGDDDCSALRNQTEQNGDTKIVSERIASGGGCGGGEADGWVGVSETSTAEENDTEDKRGEGGVSDQERVFLGIVAR